MALSWNFPLTHVQGSGLCCREITKTNQTEDKTQETNGINNGAITTGTGGESEEKRKGSKRSTRPQNGMAHVSVNNEHDTTPPNLLHRVLPPPPENLQATPPASEEQDPLYDTVKDIREVETRQASAWSNKEGTRNISENPPENQGSQKVEIINPLYVSADEVPRPPSYQEATSPLPSHEADGKIQDVVESLYAAIHKVPAGKVNVFTKTPEPSEIVAAMLIKVRKRSIKTAQLKIHDTAVNVGQECPPAIPEWHFDIESESKECTIEDTEVAGEPPAST
ncbi:uncharacterized protein LOC122936079 isoform X3 [Bufo gargarizans]|uniref:uncharacterized protein LOC122936079 isoform X3 n=1 Tax=Bufo gargarizans TaxID=30331 RepID=UPI001CF5637C|nr:uncharacterized protein LOC122936079 isoform X3 [Bufo gargarizans]